MIIKDVINAYADGCSKPSQEKNRIRKNLFDLFDKVCGLESDLNDIIDIIKPDEFLAKIEEMIKSSKRDKKKLAENALEFMLYLNKHHRTNIPTNGFNKFKFAGKYERMIEILRFLQDGKKSREDIAKHLGITSRVLSDDLNELQDGYSFLGQTMGIKLKHGDNTYDSTVHPIFLPLNLSEVYALTVGLKMVGRETVFGDIYHYLADCIYDQLSDYGKRRMKQKAVEAGVEFADTPSRKYRCEEELLNKERDRFYAYYFKSGCLCNVEYDSDTGIQSIIGYLKPASKEHIESTKVAVKSEKGEVIIDVDSILKISFAK